MKDFALLKQRLGCDVPEDLLELSLTHRSYSYENGGIPTNERLEFLGDSVLGLVVTEALYRAHPDLPEGSLAKMRSAVVNATALADVGRSINLGDFILLGRGEESTDGRNKNSILADTTEAVIGAVFLGCGMAAAEVLIHNLVDHLIAEAATLGAGLDWKTSLQELCSQLSLGAPTYVVEDSGPDHAKEFKARVRIADQLYGYGEGTSKRIAEQAAASAAFAELVTRESGDAGTS